MTKRLTSHFKELLKRDQKIKKINLININSPSRILSLKLSLILPRVSKLLLKCRRNLLLIIVKETIWLGRIRQRSLRRIQVREVLLASSILKTKNCLNSSILTHKPTKLPLRISYTILKPTNTSLVQLQTSTNSLLLLHFILLHSIRILTTFSQIPNFVIMEQSLKTDMWILHKTFCFRW